MGRPTSSGEHPCSTHQPVLRPLRGLPARKGRERPCVRTRHVVYRCFGALAAPCSRRRCLDRLLACNPLHPSSDPPQVAPLQVCKPRLLSAPPPSHAAHTRMPCHPPPCLCLRSYKVCEPHFRASSVAIHGEVCRFCQQCGRFQPLGEAGAETRPPRGCRKRLHQLAPRVAGGAALGRAATRRACSPPVTCAACRLAAAVAARCAPQRLLLLPLLPRCGHCLPPSHGCRRPVLRCEALVPDEAEEAQ